MTTRPSNSTVPRRERRAPYESSSPEIDQWRKDNPVKRWLEDQPHGTGKRLAVSLGITTAAFYYWLNGRSLPPADQLLELCDKAKVGFRQYIEWWKSHPGTP